MGFLDRYKTTADLPQNIPVFPLGGALLLPRCQLPLNIFEPRYLAMVNDAMSSNRIIGMIQPAEEPATSLNSGGQHVPSLRTIGCAGRLTSFAETDDGRILISLTGLCRFAVAGELSAVTPYRQVEADYSAFADDLTPGLGEDDVDREALLETFRAYLDANNLNADWDEIGQASNEVLVNTLSMLSPYPPTEKQALLEASNLKSRADVLIALTEIELARRSGGPRPGLQ